MSKTKTTPEQEKALAELVKQAQELDMGYGNNKTTEINECPFVGEPENNRLLRDKVAQILIKNSLRTDQVAIGEIV